MPGIARIRGVRNAVCAKGWFQIDMFSFFIDKFFKFMSCKFDRFRNTVKVHL